MYDKQENIDAARLSRASRLSCALARSAARLSFRIAIVALTVGLAAGPAVSQPILERQGNILKYGGQPIRLVGYGAYGMVNEVAFDYVQFLNIIADQHGLNFVRIWVNYHWTNSLNPFPGPRGSYNIEAQDDAYYARLRAFVCYAQQKGVVVQVCLFDAVALSSSGNRWPFFPYNTNMNIQPYLTDCHQFDDVGSTWWNNVNIPLIDRVVDELGGFGNVIYEVMNEPHCGPDCHCNTDPNFAFHDAVINRLYDRLRASDACGQPLYAGSRVISVNTDIGWAAGNPKVDLVAIHMGGADPTPPPALDTLSKPAIVSNDGHDTQFPSGTQVAGCSSLARLSQAERQSITNQMLANTFDNPTHGHLHFEFLDKGINGCSWGSNPPDYQPRVGNINNGILNVLDGYADGFHPTGTCDPPPSGVYVDGSHQGCEQGTQGCPYNTVGEANVSAMSGDSLIIAPGTYPETLTVSQPRRLTAECGLVRIGP